MKHARRGVRRLMRLAAAGGLVCGSLMVTYAMAGEPSGGSTRTAGTLRAGSDEARAAVDVITRLGDTRTAGSWTGADGRPVVGVTDADAAEEARRAGVAPKMVRYSMDRLRAATETLAAEPRVSGTAWVTDYSANRIVVRADSTVSAGDWSRLSGVAGDIGDVVRMERTEGAFTTRVNAAAPIFTDGGRCTAGFNVTDGRDVFILTAGHCGAAGTDWFRNPDDTRPLGTTVTADFPGSDFALVRYADGETLNGADVVTLGGRRGVRIIGATEPVVGQQVFRSGSTTGFRTGRITALNATVNYPEGTVTGLIETTVCAERGDSGGPLFSRGLALGVTSGGNGDCTTGGLTYFQPAVKAMQTLGVRLVDPSTDPEEAGQGGQAGQDQSADRPSPTASGPSGGPATDSPSPQPGTSAGAQAGPPAAAAGTGGTANGSGTGIISGIADDFGPLGGVAPGLAVVAASLVLLLISRWIEARQGRRNYQDHYSQTWA
ncbi:S1 family peptidase [Streptomyces sp. Je 1-79]|uniref:S1 family peptidase n=1 Tax=Streptomyces sp. Je 1-79 TaxID=2943847 RepID=UPI0021A6C327|nr:S1 family peptidase [Streptomyces sp. Je 1-79]MCT4357876.1 S1 family peptidase [Streptomyces sp. Je 1-79]